MRALRASTCKLLGSAKCQWCECKWSAASTKNWPLTGFTCEQIHVQMVECYNYYYYCLATERWCDRLVVCLPWKQERDIKIIYSIPVLEYISGEKYNRTQHVADSTEWQMHFFTIQWQAIRQQALWFAYPPSAAPQNTTDCRPLDTELYMSVCAFQIKHAWHISCHTILTVRECRERKRSLSVGHLEVDSRKKKIKNCYMPSNSSISFIKKKI